MKFSSKHHFESKLYPGVFAVMKAPTYGNRMKVDQELAAERHRISELRASFRALAKSKGWDMALLETGGEEAKALAVSIDTNGEAQIIQDQIREVSSQIDRKTLLAVVVKFEGAEFDSKEEWTDGAPPELCAEILDEFERIYRMSETEAKNSKSPSTSSAVDGAIPNSSIAECAGNVGNTGSGTAPSTSLTNSGNPA